MPDKKLGQYTQFDPTNYPREAAPDLTDSEVGRDSNTETLKAWPSTNLVPDQYAGPVPSREFETAGAPGPRRRAPSDTQPGAEARVEPSLVPPPGHTAQP